MGIGGTGLAPDPQPCAGYAATADTLGDALLFGAPLPHRRRRRRNVLVPGAAQPERLGGARDEADQLRVPPPLLGLVVEELDRSGARARPVVWAIGCDGVEDVRELQDLRRQRELRALEPVGIARAVEPFVVPADDGQQVLQALERLADALTDDGVLVHHD